MDKLALGIFLVVLITVSHAIPTYRERRGVVNAVSELILFSMVSSRRETFSLLHHKCFFAAPVSL